MINKYLLIALGLVSLNSLASDLLQINSNSFFEKLEYARQVKIAVLLRPGKIFPYSRQVDIAALLRSGKIFAEEPLLAYYQQKFTKLSRDINVRYDQIKQEYERAIAAGEVPTVPKGWEVSDRAFVSYQIKQNGE